jgi:hypothetical protein
MLKHAELAYFKTPMVAPSPFDFSGHWQNELGSYMDLQINGNIGTGTYVSAVSEGGGRTQPFPVQGSVAGDLINFSVNWGAAIASWIGHGVLDAGEQHILTLWQLVQTLDDETDPTQQWKTVLAGADEFTR